MEENSNKIRVDGEKAEPNEWEGLLSYQGSKNYEMPYDEARRGGVLPEGVRDEQDYREYQEQQRAYAEEKEDRRIKSFNKAWDTAKAAFDAPAQTPTNNETADNEQTNSNKSFNEAWDVAEAAWRGDVSERAMKATEEALKNHSMAQESTDQAQPDDLAPTEPESIQQEQAQESDQPSAQPLEISDEKMEEKWENTPFDKKTYLLDKFKKDPESFNVHPSGVRVRQFFEKLMDKQKQIEESQEPTNQTEPTQVPDQSVDQIEPIQILDQTQVLNQETPDRAPDQIQGNTGESISREEAMRFIGEYLANTKNLEEVRQMKKDAKEAINNGSAHKISIIERVNNLLSRLKKSSRKNSQPDISEPKVETNPSEPTAVEEISTDQVEKENPEVIKSPEQIQAEPDNSSPEELSSKESWTDEEIEKQYNKLTPEQQLELYRRAEEHPETFAARPHGPELLTWMRNNPEKRLPLTQPENGN